MGGGSTKVEAPKPSREERLAQQRQAELLELQTGLMQEQIRQQNLLQPFLFEELGLRPQTRDGEIVGFDQLPPSEAELAQQQITQRALQQLSREAELAEELGPGEAEIRRQLQQRTLSALQGELPVDPALNRGFEEAEQQLRERLFRQLGPGFETTTPGIQALADLEQRKQETFFGARRDQLTLAEQLTQAREARSLAQGQQAFGQAESNFGRQLQRLQTVSGLPSLTLGQALPGIQTGIQGQANLAGQFASNRQQQLQADTFNAQQAAQSQAALFGGIGRLGGAFLSGGFSTLFS